MRDQNRKYWTVKSRSPSSYTHFSLTTHMHPQARRVPSFILLPMRQDVGYILHTSNRPLIPALYITARNLWHNVTAICPALP